jgi:hypothetical protein
MNVPGRNSIPKMEIVFIAELSLCVSTAIIFIIVLSSLPAFAMAAELLVSPMFVFESFCAIH